MNPCKTVLWGIFFGFVFALAIEFIVRPLAKFIQKDQND